MNEWFSAFFAQSGWFGLFLSLATFFLARTVNQRSGKERINPLLFATVVCAPVSYTHLTLPTKLEV